MNFYKKLKKEIEIISNNHDLTYKERLRIKKLFDLIKYRLINSINYFNCQNTLFTINLKIDDLDFIYYFGNERNKNTRDSQRKLEYLKFLCSQYEINISCEETKYHLKIHASIENPNKDNKLILSKKK